MFKGIDGRKFLFLVVIVILGWIVYQLSSVIAPFAMAAGLAYILNPLVSSLEKRFSLSRLSSASLIYLFLVGLIVFSVFVISTNLVREGEQLRRETRSIFTTLDSQVVNLPDWSQEIAVDVIDSVKTATQVSPKKFAPFFSGALGKTVNVLVFFLSSFYFLKDGRKFFEAVRSWIGSEFHRDFDDLLDKINKVLGSYLRGQLILVAIMSSTTYICLSILGVPYALVLSVFTGFAEVVPFVGPVIAASAAVFVAATDPVINFGLNPLTEIVIVIAIYTVLRQLEDLFIIPNLIGKMTKLHPLIVLFSVLVGGHLFGPWGLVVAVPLAATIKVIAIHFLQKTSN